jgi:hypothetical protein
MKSKEGACEGVPFAFVENDAFVGIHWARAEYFIEVGAKAFGDVSLSC